MKTAVTLSIFALVLSPAAGLAQVGGNSVYGQAGAKARAEQQERAKHVLAKDDHPPSPTTSFVEANVLMNVKADAFVATFGVSQEGTTAAECGQKMETTLKALTDELKQTGVTDVSLDFVAQNKIYGYQIQGDTAQEKLVGLELKKNVSVRYTDPRQIEKLTQTAAKAQVFDLIKVDYIITNQQQARERLMEEAAKAIKGKLARYERLLGIKLVPPAQVYAERYAAHYPTQLYDAYQALETEDVLQDRQKYTVKTARKSRSFYFNGLDGDGFDVVVNPVVTEPVVQLTLYLKLKYEVEQPKAK